MDIVSSRQRTNIREGERHMRIHRTIVEDMTRSTRFFHFHWVLVYGFHHTESRGAKMNSEPGVSVLCVGACARASVAYSSVHLQEGQW